MSSFQSMIPVPTNLPDTGGADEETLRQLMAMFGDQQQQPQMNFQEAQQIAREQQAQERAQQSQQLKQIEDSLPPRERAELARISKHMSAIRFDPAFNDSTGNLIPGARNAMAELEARKSLIMDSATPPPTIEDQFIQETIEKNGYVLARNPRGWQAIAKPKDIPEPPKEESGIGRTEFLKAVSDVQKQDQQARSKPGAPAKMMSTKEAALEVIKRLRFHEQLTGAQELPPSQQVQAGQQQAQRETGGTGGFIPVNAPPPQQAPQPSRQEQVIVESANQFAGTFKKEAKRVGMSAEDFARRPDRLSSKALDDLAPQAEDLRDELRRRFPDPNDMTPEARQEMEMFQGIIDEAGRRKGLASETSRAERKFDNVQDQLPTLAKATDQEIKNAVGDARQFLKSPSRDVKARKQAQDILDEDARRKGVKAATAQSRADDAQVAKLLIEKKIDFVARSTGTAKSEIRNKPSRLTLRQLRDLEPHVVSRLAFLKKEFKDPTTRTPAIQQEITDLERLSLAIKDRESDTKQKIGDVTQNRRALDNVLGSGSAADLSDADLETAAGIAEDLQASKAKGRKVGRSKAELQGIVAAHEQRKAQAATEKLRSPSTERRQAEALDKFRDTLAKAEAITGGDVSKMDSEDLEKLRDAAQAIALEIQRTGSRDDPQEAIARAISAELAKLDDEAEEQDG